MTTMNMRVLAALITASAMPGAAEAAVTTPPGYIYSTQLLSNLTQSCVAAGPGGTFVGIGPSFTANAQSIVLAKESGELRLVASGFNSLADCAYDAAADVLYVTDNADNGDFGISSPFGAQTGDTVFAIPAASTASGLSAPGLELLPPDSVPAAASVAVDASGNVFISNSLGGGTGSVLKVVGSALSPFVSGLDFSGGLAFEPASGNLFVAQNLATFDNRIDRFTSAGASVPPVPFAGPSFGFGSYDLAFDRDGRLLVTGAFGGDVVAFDTGTGVATPFVSGLNFATGVTVDRFTHRVQLLSSTFAGAAEDKSLHRFTPIDDLAPGTGRAKSECLHEAYGLQMADGVAACTDGAPCDNDGKINGACLFPVGFCFNVADPKFPACSSIVDITAVRLTASPASAAIAAASAQLAAALPLSVSSCFFTDGYLLPVKTTSTGAKKDAKATLKVTATAADGRKDRDRVKLVCRPAA
jgi:hypothetical protein